MVEPLGTTLVKFTVAGLAPKSGPPEIWTVMSLRPRIVVTMVVPSGRVTVLLADWASAAPAGPSTRVRAAKPAAMIRMVENPLEETAIRRTSSTTPGGVPPDPSGLCRPLHGRARGEEKGRRGCPRRPSRSQMRRDQKQYWISTPKVRGKIGLAV